MKEDGLEDFQTTRGGVFCHDNRNGTLTILKLRDKVC